MKDYRNKAAETMKQVIDEVKKNNEGSVFEVGLIGYYDLKICETRAENVIIDFSDDTATFQKRLADLSIGCEGNFDVAEDLETALRDGLDKKKVSWKASAQHLVYLLSDAPPHGKQYWEKSELASEARVYKDFLEVQPEGVVETLLGRYCSEQKATIYLFDMLWPSTEGNYTGAFYDQLQEDLEDCVERLKLRDSDALPELLGETINQYTTTYIAAENRLISIYQESKKCPIGHYCPEGTLYPIRCGGGLYTTIRGATGPNDCQDCPAGAYCRPNDNVARFCPKGHYCPQGIDRPQACRKYTYNDKKA